MREWVRLGVGLRCGDTTLGNRTDQRGVVVGVRVGVSVSELGDGVVEEVAVAEVRRHRKPVPGACVAAG